LFGLEAREERSWKGRLPARRLEGAFLDSWLKRMDEAELHMEQYSLVRSSLLGLCLAAFLAMAAQCGRAADVELKVVATTSLSGTIVERLGQDRVSVTVITAPAACPGEGDITPSQVRATAEAALLLKHGWPGEAFCEGLLEAANNPRLKVVTVELEGNWMIPPTEAQGVERIAEALGEVDPANGDFYLSNAQPLLEAILGKGQELKAKLRSAKTSEVSVIASEQQGEFVQWAGFNLVGTYGRAADLTPDKVRELVDRGSEAGVVLVVDNLQSGPETGVQMAQEIGAVHVTLSNFPGGFDGTDTWEEAIERNVELVLEALAGHQSGTSRLDGSGVPCSVELCSDQW
jgi:zinc transport system substrate-binding protein